MERCRGVEVQGRGSGRERGRGLWGEGLLGVAEGAASLWVDLRGDQLVVGVLERCNLVDPVFVVWLEAHLASKRPSAFNSGIISEGAEQGVVGSSQIFVDGVLGQDTVGRKVGGGG